METVGLVLRLDLICALPPALGVKHCPVLLNFFSPARRAPVVASRQRVAIAFLLALAAWLVGLAARLTLRRALGRTLGAKGG